jgi:hypothetical protein
MDWGDSGALGSEEVQLFVFLLKRFINNEARFKR